MTLESRPSLAVVSSGIHKARAVAQALDNDYRVLLVSPQSQIGEREFAAELPHNRTRSALVAHEKARRWSGSVEISGLSAVIFNDVINVVPELDDFTCEQTSDYSRWLDQTMIQSGREILISAAFSARNINSWSPHADPRTIVIEAVMKARRFGKAEVMAFADQEGIDSLKKAAGGLPIQRARQFFNQDVPILVLYGPDAFSDERILIGEIQWNQIDSSGLLMLATGAHPKPLRHLVNAVQ